jgi:predicted RNase H-like HicB family nuclease
MEQIFMIPSSQIRVRSRSSGLRSVPFPESSLPRELNLLMTKIFRSFKNEGQGVDSRRSHTPQIGDGMKRRRNRRSGLKIPIIDHQGNQAQNVQANPIRIFISNKYLIKRGDERYIAVVLELRGCSAFSETRDEALKEIEGAKSLWLDAAMHEGKSVPTLDRSVGHPLTV